MTLVGDRLYSALAPLAYADDGGDLQALCGAVGTMFEQVAQIVETGPNGEPGWSQLLDVDRCPAYALPWLGQFVGVTVDPTLDEAGQRRQIRAETGMARGSVAAIVAAAQRRLTGTRTVVMRERSATACSAEPAYGLTVFTFTSETPDPTGTEADIRAVKPAGIVLEYLTDTGQDFETVRENFATFADLTAGYTDFDGMRTDTP